MGTPFHRATSAMTLVRSTPDLSWQEEAACVGSDPEAWVGESEHAAQAVAICEQCPARVKCLEWAVASRQKFMIWGGVDFGPAKASRVGPRTCKNGHPRTPENVYERKDGRKGGDCKLCARDRTRARRKAGTAA